MKKLLINDLIKLSEMSLRGIARAAVVDPSNLSGWLKDKNSYISDDGVKRLYKVLGMNESGLSTRKVHHFRTDRDLESLQRIINALMGFTEIYPVKRHQSSLFNTLKEGPIAILAGEKGAFAIVRLMPKLIKEMHKSTCLPYVSPEFLNGTEWGIAKDEENKNSGEITLSDEAFDRLMSDQIRPDDVEAYLAGVSAITWTDVIEKAKRNNLSPSHLSEFIDTLPSTNF